MSACSSSSPADTRAIAAGLARMAEPGDIVTLDGDLGAGKTEFAKGFAEGLGVPYPEDVVSPTFSLMQIYEGGRLPLYHFDIYRLEDASEAEEIGIDEYLFGRGVCLIEWASRIEEILPEKQRTAITLERVPGQGEDVRRITIRRPDDHEDTRD
ncbi:MAG: tRNA (adenosine(37)-N6)-threonylcarbamoyltransferase complex ATPase subunit type 1 TsaE [Lachnospiraceae bacterium]|nr:tRNA (adenosine(37)-N6)-threonylcarbamoyltransferase complex ATPase subunit type 1 TsaE [Lachnospiraceae bacterium]